MIVLKRPHPAIIAILLVLVIALCKYLYNNSQEYEVSTEKTEQEYIQQDKGLQVVVEKSIKEPLRQKDTSLDFELHDIGEFFHHVESPTATCNNLQVIGGMLHNYKGVPVIDGDKDVCLDKSIGMNPTSCIVYSFGIRNEWSFDDSMAWYGCNVYAFDPTMGMKDHKRGERVSYYDLGIGNKDGTATIMRKKCQVKRFTSIMKQLGHEKDAVIDYLKMDVEGAELQFLEDVIQNEPHILQRIRQIGMEIHPLQYKKSKFDVFKKYYKLIKQLESHGFRLISSKGNPYPFSPYYLEEVGRKVHKYYDLVWVGPLTYSL